MTLSDRRIRSLLGKRFVCTWGNVEGDPNAGASFAHAPSDPPAACLRGNGEHNMQVLMLTPEGELLNAVAGYLSPDELREELDLVLSIWDGLAELEQDRRRGRADLGVARAAVVESAHRRFLAAFEQREPEGSFAAFIRWRVVADHRFSAENALADARRFRSEDMVGSAQTFFGGYQGGVRPKELGRRPRFQRARRRP